MNCNKEWIDGIFLCSHNTMHMKRIFFVWLCLCLTNAFLYAEARFPSLPIDIEADQMNYLQNQRFFEASGNVRATYELYQISANYLLVDLTDKVASFSGGFSMQRAQRAISGESLLYDLDKQTGTARHIRINLGKVRLDGEILHIYKDKVLIDKSLLTTCHF